MINARSLIFVLLGLVHLLLEHLLRYNFLEHVLRVLDRVVLQAELPNVHTNVLITDEFLLQNVLQENEHDAHHPFLVDLVLVTLAAALVHAVLNEQMRELLWEFDVVAQPVEHFEQTSGQFHL